MTLNELNLLISSCWNWKYQPPTIDMTKGNFTGCYRIGLNSISVSDFPPF